MLTKIALTAALIIGSVSATLAKDNAGKASGHHASYARTHVLCLNAASTDTARPLTQFEKTWFDYQDHE
jgi:hypothetical protein